MKPLKQAIYSSRTADKFVVRLPDGLREKIAVIAATNHRSMNSEIVMRLETTIGEPTESKSDNPVTEVVNQIKGEFFSEIQRLNAHITALTNAAMQEGAGPKMRAAVEAALK